MSHDAGVITNPGTAPQDPLFFLLHCNVDRLWAKWQWAFRLHDPAAARAFTAGPDPPRSPPRRPPLAVERTASRRRGPPPLPEAGWPPSPMTDAPGTSPRVRDAIDYFGLTTSAHLGFAYDDVPFQMGGI